MEALLHRLGTNSVTQLYPLLAKIPADKCLEVLPEVCALFEGGQLNKELVYLSLLINPDRGALNALLEHDRQANFDVRNAASIFNECHYEGRNWFERAVDVDFDLRAFNKALQECFWTVRLLACTNDGVIDVECIRKCLRELEDVDDEYTKVYVDEVRYVLDVLDFVGEYSAELFYRISRSSLLDVFKDYVCLKDESKWDAIADKLKAGEVRKGVFEYNSELGGCASDHELFRAYTVLHDVVRCIKLCNEQCSSDITAIVARAESNLLSLNNSTLQLQLLEDVFALCFLRTKDDDGFAVDARHLRLLLCFLRSCLGRLRLKRDGRLKNLGAYVSDAFWRLETLADVGYGEREDFVSRMLAPPTSLIGMCLKDGRFDRAGEVIEIFNLHGSELALEILRTEVLLDFRRDVSKVFRIRDYQKRAPQITPASSDLSLRKLHDALLSNKELSIELCDVFDVALTLPCGHTDSVDLLELVKGVTGDFYDGVRHMFHGICVPEGLDLSTLLWDSNYCLDVDTYVAQNNFYANLLCAIELFKGQLTNKPFGTINPKHAAHASYLRLHELLPSTEAKYLVRLFNYLKSLLQFYYTEGNRSDLVAKGRSVSYFELLHYSRNEIFRRLVFDENADPQDFEPLAAKLKIDLLYHIAANCFPQIELTATSRIGNEGQLLKPSRSIFAYVQRRNWLLAYIVSAVFDLQETNVRFNENRTRYFVQFATSHEIDRLKLLFAGNPTVACLHTDYVDRCVEHVGRNVFDDETDAAEEISEGDYRCNWRYLLELLDSVPERQTREHPAFERIRDRVLSNLVLDDFETEHYKYVRLIKNDDVRMGLLLEHSTSWPGDFCLSLLKSELTCENKWRDVLSDWLKTVSFCEEVRLLFGYKIWSEVHELCCENPEAVMSKLLQKPKVHLLLSFADLYSASHLLTSSVTYDSVAALFSDEPHLADIERLFVRLPEADVIGIGVSLLNTLKEVDHLRFVVDHLEKLSGGEAAHLRNVRIGLEILECFTPNERDGFRCLVDSPLDMVEMLLMNMKLDRLGMVIERIRPQLLHSEFSEDVVCAEHLDELLKRFARKSLEFRGILQPHPRLLQTADNKLMQSLDSLYGPDRKHFVMPATIPDKSDWVPNNEVVECMCCQNTTFSMFNRRHHCRRCGRVVCFNCSTKRMHVSTYGDIMVRVCVDCYDQSHADGNVSMSDTASAKSIMYDYWFLTDDRDHNRIVRQEFSYEHAPSVSLCLSIMKFHSKDDNYPKFLLEQCDYLLTLLQPVSPGASPEIDYSLIIRMLKSLAIAAKMISSECQPHWGASQADRILSQADLLGLLVERGCLNLLSTSSSSQSGAPFVDARILRKLRDKLLEKEQFNFALDVSTKAGLDNAGVFAAWGKSYLKAGCLQAAREKFQRCLEKTAFYEASSELSLDESLPDDSRKRTLSKLSTASDTRPLKNPPLLVQIVQILESQTAKLDGHLKRSLAENRAKRASSNLSLNNLMQQGGDMAICVRRKLAGLRSIASASYEHDDVADNELDPIFFDECVYYLRKYGTHLSLLQFYVRHNRIAVALRYVVDNRVPADVFVEVYTSCLKDGKVALLQETMTTIDSTLEIWKDYLKQICRYLEKQNLLHSLYQLQQFMGDYVRAAMTCIRFYKSNATTYKELENNTCHLVKAEEHLRQELEQQQWVEVNTVRKQDVDSTKSNFEEKGLTNPSLVLKMDSRDIAKNINTIKRQIEVTKFLAKYEREDMSLLSMLPDIAASTNEDEREQVVRQLPTLFDGQQEKLQLTVLIIVSGDKVDDGFALVDQIIQEHKLKPIKVYCQLGQQFARIGDHRKVEQLVSCIRSNGNNDANVTDMCDRLLALAVRTLYASNKSASELETLIKLISDKATKISMYIETKQLKTAYVLALRYSRYGDIRRILKEAEMLNKPDIKKLCQKLLQSHSHSHKE